MSRVDTADSMVFKVVLDTHSVNLDEYDLARLAVLRTAQDLESAPIAWDAPAGGHHREETLRFPPVADDGSLFFEPGAGHLVLVIRDVAGIADRSFHFAA